MAQDRLARNGSLDRLLRDIRGCRKCIEDPDGPHLPHEPRPVLQVGRGARLAVFGQAPGMKVHLSGRPFTDASGQRLRYWMGIGEDVFYDPNRVAVVPMGFCFPGYNSKGGDLPPRRECAELWRDRLLGQIAGLELVLLVGQYAQAWHLKGGRRRTLTETVAAWREIVSASSAEPGSNSCPVMMPLPHPSWRNTAWLKRNPWFEAELLPELRRRVAAAVAPGP